METVPHKEKLPQNEQYKNATFSVYEIAEGVYAAVVTLESGVAIPVAEFGETIAEGVNFAKAKIDSFNQDVASPSTKTKKETKFKISLQKYSYRGFDYKILEISENKYVVYTPTGADKGGATRWEYTVIDYTEPQSVEEIKKQAKDAIDLFFDSLKK